MSCPVGRTYTPEHPTCRTCPIPCRKPKKVRVAVNSGPAGEGRWMTTLDLSSPNEWTNKQSGRFIYRSIKAQWKKALSGAFFHFGLAKGMRRVEIVRYVASQGHFYDKDNLYGGCKPLLDCLVAASLLIDDADGYLTLNVRQEIGTPRVEISITEETRYEGFGSLRIFRHSP